MGLLFDLPSQETSNGWKPINILTAPPDIKDIEFNAKTSSRESFLEMRFREVKVGVAPERNRSLKNNFQVRRKQDRLKHRVTSTIHAAMGDTIVSMATEISQHYSNFRLWDKGQLVVILSRTKVARNTTFVENKSDTFHALKTIILRRVQWSDCMDRVLDLITIDEQTSEAQEQNRRIFTQETYPFRIADISLPQCRTEFAYLFISMRNRAYCYIGQTNCLRVRMQSHNNGYGSSSTHHQHLRPFAVMAYICGFDCHRELMEYVEYKWKEERIRNGNEDPRQWASHGQSAIYNIDQDRFIDIISFDLTSVCLFGEN